MIYYHVTTKKALSKIKKEGLQPQIGKRSKKIGEVFPAIYLFTTRDDMEDAICNWLGEELEGDKTYALKIDIPKGFPLDEGVQGEWEVRSYQMIPMEYVQAVEAID